MSASDRLAAFACYGHDNEAQEAGTVYMHRRFHKAPRISGPFLLLSCSTSLYIAAATKANRRPRSGYNPVLEFDLIFTDCGYRIRFMIISVFG